MLSPSATGEIMAFIPLLLILALIGIAWPAYLPHALAYFIIGGGLGGFFGWACRRKGDPKLEALAPAIVIWNLYAWPVAIVSMFMQRNGGRP